MRVFPEWADQRSVLFGNMERRLDPDLPLFADRTGPAGFAHRGQGRGMVHLDYDGDGDQDIVIFNNEGRPALLRNDAIHPGRPAAGGWLRVFLDTTADPTVAPDGFGARVVVTNGGGDQVRAMFGGAGYLTSSERSAHFGLGAGNAAGAPIDELRVEWPDGLVTRFSAVPAGATYTVRPQFRGCRADPWVSVGSVRIEGIGTGYAIVRGGDTVKSCG